MEWPTHTLSFSILYQDGENSLEVSTFNDNLLFGLDWWNFWFFIYKYFTNYLTFFKRTLLSSLRCQLFASSKNMKQWPNEVRSMANDISLLKYWENTEAINQSQILERSSRGNHREHWIKIKGSYIDFTWSMETNIKQHHGKHRHEIKSYYSGRLHRCANQYMSFFIWSWFQYCVRKYWMGRWALQAEVLIIFFIVRSQESVLLQLLPHHIYNYYSPCFRLYEHRWVNNA